MCGLSNICVRRSRISWRKGRDARCIERIKRNARTFEPQLKNKTYDAGSLGEHRMSLCTECPLSKPQQISILQNKQTPRLHQAVRTAMPPTQFSPASYQILPSPNHLTRAPPPSVPHARQNLGTQHTRTWLMDECASIGPARPKFPPCSHHHMSGTP